MCPLFSIETKNMKRFFAFSLVFNLFVILHSSFPQEPASSEQKPSAIERSTAYAKEVILRINSLFSNSKEENFSYKNTTDGLKDSLLYHALSIIKEQIPPFVYEKYAIFTYYDKSEKSSVNLISSADNYTTLYPFVRLSSNKKILVLLFPRPLDDIELNYRLVINGIWNHDLSNPNYIVDKNGVQISTIAIPAIENRYLPSFTTLENNMIRFMFSQNELILNMQSTSLNLVVLEPNDTIPVFLNANFTGWDPFLLKMEAIPNRDSQLFVDVRLEPGIYYYYYQVGNTSVLDPRNQDIVRLESGLYVNRIVVKEEN